MAHPPLGSLLHFLRQCRDRGAEATDGELLRRHAGGDEAAFATLLHRHASMVWGVCRRLLDNEQDAEDAFQAAFLVLLRKAESLRVPQSLAAFLHGVAFRIAQKARVTALRRRRHEAAAETRTASDPMAPAELRELRALLDDELDHLPKKYRAPLVLCYLEGKSYVEAARQLGWRDGTVCGRLARARELLRQRLSRRGLTLSGAALAATLSEPAPAATMATVSRMAVLFTLGETITRSISTPVATLAQGALHAMTVAKLKVMTVSVAVFCILAGGAGLAAHMFWTVEKSSPERTETPTPNANKAEQSQNESMARTDHYGDPLPPGAIARIGTVRFREGTEMIALSASPDGKMLASTGGGSMIRLWDAATGKQLFLLNTRLGGVGSLAFSPDGKWLAGGGAGAIHVWDTATRMLLRTLPAPKTANYTVAFSADSRRLAAGGRNYSVRVWDLDSGKETLQLKGHQGILWSFAFSPDGKYLATGSDDKAIYLWDAAIGEELRRLVPASVPGRRSVHYVAFSPDSKVVAGGSGDGTIYLWDIGTGRERLTIPRRDKSRENPAIVVFSPDGKYLANRNPIGIVYDAATGKERYQLEDVHSWVPHLVFSLDGKTLIGDGLHRVRFWDAATGKEIFKDAAHRDAVSSVVFSPDGKTLFTAGRDDFAGAWETSTGRERFRFQGERRTQLKLKWLLNEVAVAPDGKTAAAWLAGELYTWDVRQPKPVREYSAPVAGFDCRQGLAFSPQGRLLAAGWSWKDNLTRLWVNGMEKEPILLKSNYTNFPNSLKFSPNGKTLASASIDGSARLWDSAAGKELQTLPGVKGLPGPKGPKSSAAASSLAFSPDNQTLALGGSDGTIGLWDKDSGREIRHFVLSSGSLVQSLAFSPDDKTVAAGYVDGTVRFWEKATGKLRREWPTHIGNILSLAFSPDGRLLASAGSDSTVLIWTTDEAANRRDLSAKDLEALWNDLAADDAVRGYRAVGALGTSARQSVPFLRAHLYPVVEVDVKRLAQRIADLDDARFEVRDKASAELAKYGDLAEPALHRTLAAQPSLEVRRRIEAILEQLNRPPSAEQLRLLRAVEVLERVLSREARTLLEELAQGAPGARLTREARAALQRLTSRKLQDR
ncbi:MAG TPA: sigma-70 family RNA polymerase sigma factor [Gemmataceae bacterium]|jgi:RNA polymerase sigma factor (sigma-70 family)